MDYLYESRILQTKRGQKTTVGKSSARNVFLFGAGETRQTQADNSAGREALVDVSLGRGAKGLFFGGVSFWFELVLIYKRERRERRE